MDLFTVHGSRPEFDLDSLHLPGDPITTRMDTDSLPSVNLERTHSSLNIDDAYLIDIIKRSGGLVLGILLLKSPHFNDEMVTNITGHTIVPGARAVEDVEGVRLFNLTIPGTYHICPEGVIKINDQETPGTPLGGVLGNKSKTNEETGECKESNAISSEERVKADSDSDYEIQEHGKSEDWWKESRWMKVRAIPEAVNSKPPFEYSDLRKNWQRFAALTAEDRSLRFNTPRLRSLRRSVFGEQMGVKGMKYRRDTGIDYGKKEKMILPSVDIRLPRNKNKQPPVFRGVPKAFYDWSRDPRPRLSGNRPDAPKQFYDWTAMMEEKKQNEATAELTDFERFVAREVGRRPKSDFESFLRSSGTEAYESMDAYQYKYKDLERDADPEVSGFGGYDEMSTSTSEDDDDDEDESGESDSTFNESEDEYMNDDLVSMAWNPEEF